MADTQENSTQPQAQAQAQTQTQAEVQPQTAPPVVEQNATATAVALPVASSSAPNVPTTESPQPVTNAAGVQTTGVMNSGLTAINREAKEKEVMQKAQKMGMNYIDIAATPVNPDLLKLLDPEKAKSALIFPFYRLGKKLRVTVAHPTDPATRAVITELKLKGYLINVNISSEESINEALRLYQSEQYKTVKKIDTTLDEMKLQTYEKELQDLSAYGEKLKNINSEEAVYLISVGALKSGSSDIHLEAEETFVRVRYRIDGILHEVYRIDKASFVHIASQLKYQAKLKVNVSDIPQDGRYNFQVNERKIDVRVSTLPTEFGESFVLRLLDSGKHLVSFEELGYSGQYLRKIEKLTEISHGMILMTGPTGSGKTTSLYTMLSRFNKPGVKIITLEDPIEYHLVGVAQSQIHENLGYTFAGGLRSILRQDPEVIMIGEIRDKETAETAAQAALTGHVLLSTLHTNSAIETIPRLINIGLPAFMIAPSLNTIIAQRLVRRICPHCAKQETVSTSQKEELQRVIDAIKQVRPSEELSIPETLPLAQGCEECSHSGYKGRICIVEMLEVDFEMKDLILNKASTTKMIEAARRKGMITMREDGVIKVLHGETTLEEVHRATTVT